MDDFLEFVLYVQENGTRIPKRYLRDVENPLEFFDDQQFFCRYRFSKYVFAEVIYPIIRSVVENSDERGRLHHPVTKALSVMRFYATGNFQLDIGDNHGISQPTECNLIKSVSLALAMQVPKYIVFPNLQEMAHIKRKFYDIAGFPGVIGCIDGSHIPIQNPDRENGEQFRNRKGFFSINIQIVSGPDGQIFDIVNRWPGSTHDSRIFKNSKVFVKLQNRLIKGIILGDSGYMQNQFCYTPVPNPQNDRERRYNNSHIATRNTIERLFGVLKRRFPALRRKLANKLVTTTHIISACAVLHNIAVKYREPEPLHDEEPSASEEDDNEHAPQTTLGRTIRTAFINQHFN